MKDTGYTAVSCTRGYAEEAYFPARDRSGTCPVRPGHKVRVVPHEVKSLPVLRCLEGSEEAERVLFSDAYVVEYMRGEAVVEMERVGKDWERVVMV